MKKEGRTKEGPLGGRSQATGTTPERETRHALWSQLFPVSLQISGGRDEGEKKEEKRVSGTKNENKKVKIGNRKGLKVPRTKDRVQICPVINIVII